MSEEIEDPYARGRELGRALGDALTRFGNVMQGVADALEETLKSGGSASVLGEGVEEEPEKDNVVPFPPAVRQALEGNTKRIKINQAQCLECGDVVVSQHRHDFRFCSCHAMAVDGGNEYLKRTGEPSRIKELSEWE